MMPEDNQKEHASKERPVKASIEVELQPDMELGQATVDLDEAEMQERIQKQLKYAEMKAKMKERMDKGQKPNPEAPSSGEKKEEETVDVEVPPEVCKVIFDSGSYVISCPKFRLDDNQAETMANSLTVLLEGFPVGGSKIWHLIIVLMITLSKVAACKEAIMRMMPKKEKPKDETAEPPLDYTPIAEPRKPNPKKITFADNIVAAVNRANYDTAKLKADIPKE
jgi:hypothetical protein